MTAKHASPSAFVLFPAVAMSLGWGLRGYIGGGPFGAMIPGAFVALSLCMLLGYGKQATAIAALFGAVGVGYCGEMTYGQTLGFVMHTDTLYWGLLGTTLKGAVWGFLGGAVLGVGLTWHRYKQRDLIIAFALTVVAFYVGWKHINDPKLIYFSNRIEKPRDESWAGFLFAATAFLAYLRIRTKDKTVSLPLRFALLGALGGGIGFGLGPLWFVVGPHVPLINPKWIGWWKMMEFSFGFSFGAFLGLAAYRMRDWLKFNDTEDAARDRGYPALIALIAALAVVTWGIPALLGQGFPMTNGATSHLAHFIHDIAGLLPNYIVFGGLCAVIAMRSTTAAWHIAITLTYAHTVLDLVEDLPKAEGAQFSTTPLAIVLMLSVPLVAVLVHSFKNRPRTVRNEYLLILWFCYAVATLRTLHHLSEVATAHGAGSSVFITANASTFITHFVFTLFAVVTTAFILRIAGPQRPEDKEIEIHANA